jgi:hypothetical protein
MIACCQDSLFSPQQLREDLSFFQTVLEEAHPGLYRYTPKDYFDHQFLLLNEQLRQPMREQEFYKLLNPLVAKIKCGHTKFHRDGKPDNLFAFSTNGLFPLRMHFVDRKAFVLDSYIDSALVDSGTEVVSINGQKITELIERLFRHIYTDGNIVSARYQELNRNFSGWYATFIGTAPQFTINYRDAGGGRVFSKVIPATDANAIRKAMQSNTKTSPPLSLQFPLPGVAVMRIAVFTPQPGAPEFEPFLKSAFDSIRLKNIRHLVLDLRDNGGGIDHWGKVLYSYLTEKPFRYYDHLSVTRNTPFSFEEKAALPDQIASYRQFIVPQGKSYVFTRHPNLGVQQPAANPYLGKLYVLQNGLSFSVTSEFAAAVYDNNRGVFIGEENGGALGGNNSGAFAIVKLPHTKLNLAVPLVGYYMHLKAKKNLDRGVPANHPVQPAVGDIIQGRDAVMSYTLNLIQKGLRIQR